MKKDIHKSVLEETPVYLRESSKQVNIQSKIFPPNVSLLRSNDDSTKIPVDFGEKRSTELVHVPQNTHASDSSEITPISPIDDSNFFQSVNINSYLRAECTNSEESRGVAFFNADLEGSDELFSVPTVEIPQLKNADHVSQKNNSNQFVESPQSANADMRSELCAMALRRKVPKCVMADFLHILKKFCPSTGLPVDSRSLLSTPRKADISKMGFGKYTYFGVRSGINDSLKYEWNKVNTRIQIQVALDGLPIANCGGSQFWPLMGRITCSSTIFLIACYWGKTKPSSANDYLRDFVNEITLLINEGYSFENNRFQISLHSLICDIPAKAFALMTKGHAGYRSCSKCTIEGFHFENHVTFADVDCSQRTDLSLFNEDDDEFQHGRSILLDIPGFGCVTGVPIDPMHALSEGVQKRKLRCWGKGPAKVRILTKRNCDVISAYLRLLALHTPQEFGRKVASIDNHGQWKATQYRLFLVYIGIVALRSIVADDNEVLVHFRKLCIATRLLSVGEKVEDAEKFLKKYVLEFSQLYGVGNTVTCVHALLHISDDVNNLSPLDSFSAYPFENFLRHLKRTVHGTWLPLEELANTFSSMLKFGVGFCTKPTGGQVEPQDPHANGPVVMSNWRRQFRKHVFEHFTLTNEILNNCCIINKDVIVIENFVVMCSGSVVVVGRKFLNLTDLFETPCASSAIQIFKAQNVSCLKCWEIEKRMMKCMCLPLHDCKDAYAILPLLHSVLNNDEEYMN